MRTPKTHKVITVYWRKPIPTAEYDWEAYFDDDEPNDNGQMQMGFGKTEEAAIADLMEWEEMRCG